MIVMQTDILDLVHDSIITCDAGGTILSWNKASESLYGWPDTAAIGRNINQLLGTRHDDIAQAQHLPKDRGWGSLSASRRQAKIG
jgi:PAS domain S-box-containing protein